MTLSRAKEVLKIYYYDLMGWVRSLVDNPTDNEILEAVKLCLSVWGENNMRIKTVAEELIANLQYGSPLILQVKRKDVKDLLFVLGETDL